MTSRNRRYDSDSDSDLSEDHRDSYPRRGRRSSDDLDRDRDDDRSRGRAARAGRSVSRVLARSKSRAREALDTFDSGGSLGQALQVLRPRSASRPDPASNSNNNNNKNIREHTVTHTREIHRRHHHQRSPSSTTPDGPDGEYDQYDELEERRRTRQYRGRSTHDPGSRPRVTAAAAATADEPGGRRRHSSTGRWKQAIGAAVAAGALEAYHMRDADGGGGGSGGGDKRDRRDKRDASDKVVRIGTSMLAAAAIDRRLAGDDPEEHSKRHILASTLGGFMVNRLTNGNGKG